RFWVLPQQRGRAHQDARDAVAALHRLLGDKGPLQRVWPLSAAQAFRRRDVFIGDRPKWRVAGTYGEIADNGIAGPAFAGAATEMRPAQDALAAEDIEQRTVRIGIDGRLDAIQAEMNLRHCKPIAACPGIS